MITLLLSTLAHGQALPPDSDGISSDGGYDAHGFHIAPFDADLRDPLAVQRPGRLTSGHWFAGALLEYVDRPVVLQPGNTDPAQIMLDDVVAVNLSAGVDLHERVRLHAAAPLFLASTAAGVSQGADIGDLRLDAMVSLLAPQEDDGGVGIGLVPYLVVPTGDAAARLGSYGVAGGMLLAATGEIGALTLSGHGGLHGQPTDDIEVSRLTRVGATVQAGGAGSVLVADRHSVGLEVRGQVPVAAISLDAIGTPTEAMATWRFRADNGGHLTAGVGTQLVYGSGAAPLRLLVGGGFGAPEAARDLDGDGLADRDDQCVDQAETPNGYRDDDGCPDALPTLTARAVIDGTPRDDASISYLVAGVPMAAGSGTVARELPPGSAVQITAALGNCWAGELTLTTTDQPQRVDVPLTPTADAALGVEVVGPDEQPIAAVVTLSGGDCAPPPSPSGAALGVPAGEWTVRVEADGYRPWEGNASAPSGVTTPVRVTLEPALVQVTAEEITILDKVYFTTGRATIRDVSFSLLDEVARTILDHELAQVEVQGHTDSQGSAASNLTLSQRRADAVRDYLIGKGVAATTLTARGYGEDQPVADNGTAEGREANRRVTFAIIEP